MPEVDPANPIPLYLQIAEAIRRRIERGELAEGDALTPLREAAEEWGVNLHTVRHAYTSLAREGLVESKRARGTRVLSTRRRPRRPAGEDHGRRAHGASDLDDLIDRALTAARARGMTPDGLAAAVVARAGHAAAGGSTVYVVECSAGQCESHAREIEAAWDVHAIPWSLDAHAEAPPGPMVATYFHYNDVRRRWPARLRETQFVAIGPDAAIAARLPARARRVRVCESDAATAEVIAADVSVLLGERVAVEPFVASEPDAALQRRNAAPVLFPPRAWARLSDAARADRRALPLTYTIDPGDLAALAERFGWRPARTGGVRREPSHA